MHSIVTTIAHCLLPIIFATLIIKYQTHSHQTPTDKQNENKLPSWVLNRFQQQGEFEFRTKKSQQLLLVYNVDGLISNITFNRICGFFFVFHK